MESEGPDGRVSCPRTGPIGGRMTGAEIILGVSAAGALVVSQFVARFFLPLRVRDETAINDGVRDQETAVDGDRGRGRPGRDRGQGGGVRGSEIAVIAAAPRRPEPQWDAYMPAREHIERFIAWAIVDAQGRVRMVRQTFFEMHQLYLEWCACHYVTPLPDKTWQTVMKAHGQVSTKREPIKCPATGRILRKSSGAPERVTYYTVRPPRPQPVLPGKVPVGEIVEARPVLTKAQREVLRQQAAGNPAQTRKRGQSLPERIAA